MSAEDDGEDENGVEENECYVAEVRESDEDRRKKRKLREYVCQMHYPPIMAEQACVHTEALAKPHPRHLLHTYKHYGPYLSPAQRRQRLKRLNRDTTHITPEQFEQYIKEERKKEKKVEKMQLRKQDLYYNLLQKLEGQSRQQYLNVMIKKFADFVSKLATTMQIPLHLVDPYARMYRGIFCHILTALGLQPCNTTTGYYNSPHIKQYELVHKLSHALLSLIIKALEEANKKDPNELQFDPPEDNDWDKYIKDRLMCAAARKCQQEENLKKKAQANQLAEIITKCTNYDMCYEYL